MNLDAYFNRIGFTGARTPTLETLRELHLRHAQTIPFENLDSLLKRPVNLDAESLERKLVEQRRGGYCYEQNGLFVLALEALGFRVTRLGGRVVYQRDPDSFPHRTHMLLRVDVGDESWIADVGFGGFVLTSPLRLAVDAVQETPHESFRIIRWRDEYIMETLVRDAWVPLYRFTLAEQAQSDYELGNWYVSTHPSSLFVNFPAGVAAGAWGALLAAKQRAGDPPDERRDRAADAEDGGGDAVGARRADADRRAERA